MTTTTDYGNPFADGFELDYDLEGPASLPAVPSVKYMQPVPADRLALVSRFFRAMCTVTPAVHGQQLDPSECTGRRDLAAAFNAWAVAEGGSEMGERAFFAAVCQLDGVVDVRKGRNSRAFNVVLAASQATGRHLFAVPDLPPEAPADEPAAAPWSKYGHMRLAYSAT